MNNIGLSGFLSTGGGYKILHVSGALNPTKYRVKYSSNPTKTHTVKKHSAEKKTKCHPPFGMCHLYSLLRSWRHLFIPDFICSLQTKNSMINFGADPQDVGSNPFKFNTCTQSREKDISAEKKRQHVSHRFCGF